MKPLELIRAVGPLWDGVNDTEWQGGKNISPCGNLTSLTTILPEIGGIQMNHGWSPHDGMGAPSCGALMMAWGLHHEEASLRHEGSK